jgi:cysteinyl-tRNA synthetase
MKCTNQSMKACFNTLVDDVLAVNMQTQSATADATDGLMDLVLNIRKEAREKKDWNTSDLIRDHLDQLDIVVKDGKDGSSWNWK